MNFLAFSMSGASNKKQEESASVIKTL